MAKFPDIYADHQWDPVRQYVIARSNGLCDRCFKKKKIVSGKIVHHKIWLTKENKSDWDIAFNPDNLEYLCDSCHNEVHYGSSSLSNFMIPPGLKNS